MSVASAREMLVSTTSGNENDNVGTAISFLLLGTAGGLSLDICAKWLLADYPLEQFVFLRSLFGVVIYFLIIRWNGGFSALRTRRWKWHALRTALACGAMFGFFYGVSRMPLVNALTIAFVAPLIVTALSVPILGEKVGWRRWLAVVVGFVGMLVVLRPGPDMFTPAAIALLICAACYACLGVTARKLADTESSFSLSIYLVLGPLIVSSFLLPGNYVEPTANGWFFFILSGVFSVIAWIGLVGGYRRASPSILAPFEYLAIPGAAIAGYIIWNETPDIWVVVGAAIIIGSGLYIVHREVDSVATSRYLRAFSAGTSAAITKYLRRSKVG